MSSAVISPEETLFFCSGLPKTGTTFLQRLLNCHPDISCPSEHQFHLLKNSLNSVFHNYNKALDLIDKRTGAQGATRVSAEVLSSVFRHSVEAIAKDAANGRHFIGINDNGIISQLDEFNRLFESPRMICIIRNPIDAGISAWQHNLRLAKEENPVHKEMMIKYGGFDGWLRQNARWFQQAATSVTSYTRQHSNAMIIRYEDLATSTADTTQRLLMFLGAESAATIIADMVESSRFETMKKDSANPAFFHSASISFGADEVSDSLREDIASIATDGLQALGYDVLNSKVLADYNL